MSHSEDNRLTHQPSQQAMVSLTQYLLLLDRYHETLLEVRAILAPFAQTVQTIDEAIGAVVFELGLLQPEANEPYRD